ncbi:hypothetical protein GALMADRAFT_252763 [Galerina marginata CBS 339.88]|uniref:Uncharacterized protein n=1 Tax=Galerina marginata (strain CBS 339.88) TaxID=685588 RepID=A0A067SRE7_GALM3|nr:hypothetical protein GALMADRAFT_252763 [Galerina marginata CBS 339.88]
MATPFLLQRFQAQSAGIAIVRDILKRESFPNGFTTAQLYKLAMQAPPPANFQPYPLGRRPPPPPTPKPHKKKIYNQKPKPEDSYPPNPDHPIRSVRFLKEYILPFLRGANEITITQQPTAKTLTAQEADDAPKTKKQRLQLTKSQVEFVWKVVPPENRVKVSAPPPEKLVVGREVGVGGNVSHLNKRRMLARAGKISREVDRMKAYNQFSETRDGLLSRLRDDPELNLEMAEAVENSAETDLPSLLAMETQLGKGRPRQRTALASVDTEQHLKEQTDKIRRLVAYKAQAGHKSTSRFI